MASAAESAAQAAVGFTFIVNSSKDAADRQPGDGACATAAGVCTLRAAIQEANALAGLDQIHFAIGSGVQTINVGSTLPTITSPVIIDGWTQPGFGGAPLIVLHGGNGHGLCITSGGSLVRGLVINNFSGSGIVLSGGRGNVLEGNYIGAVATGAAGLGNANSGVLIDGSADNRIGGRERAQRNLISGNAGKGNEGGIKIDGGATVSGYGQGRHFLGQTGVTTNSAGNATFSIAIGLSLPAGWVVTSTATDPSGNTSEFSACTTVR